MVTIKGADQTRRDEGPPFIADFVTREPPPRNRRIRSLRATPPIHPSTPMLSSSAEAKSICGIERRAKRKTERERERERERDAVTLTWRAVAESTESSCQSQEHIEINARLTKAWRTSRRSFQGLAFSEMRYVNT